MEEFMDGKIALNMLWMAFRTIYLSQQGNQDQHLPLLDIMIDQL